MLWLSQRPRRCRKEAMSTITAQICSYNDVSHGDIANVVQRQELKELPFLPSEELLSGWNRMWWMRAPGQRHLAARTHKLGGSLSNHLCENTLRLVPNSLGPCARTTTLRMWTRSKRSLNTDRRWLRDLQALSAPSSRRSSMRILWTEDVVFKRQTIVPWPTCSVEAHIRPSRSCWKSRRISCWCHG
jgi:hypothetical protein